MSHPLEYLRMRDLMLLDLVQQHGTLGRVALALHVPGVEGAAATGEQMLLNMDMRGPRSAPFAPEVLLRLQPLAAQHATLPRPARLGSVIGLPPKK